MVLDSLVKHARPHRKQTGFPNLISTNLLDSAVYLPTFISTQSVPHPQSLHTNSPKRACYPAVVTSLESLALDAAQVVIQRAREVDKSAQAIQNDLMTIASNQTTAGKHIERIAQVAVETRGNDLCRRGTPAEQVTHLAAIDLEGREALGEGAGGDGAGWDCHVGAAATGIEVGAKTDQAGDIAGFQLGRCGQVEEGDIVGTGRGDGGGLRGWDGGDAKGKEG
ncbi:hypothetical protein B0T16DRAFT_419798 [Cercophora newfieldiana]|uniref:Uncharacterized protein n=1 Tax=Cercophora newfieldiana TaxID=92897 RepID=A0AA39XW84_9PEZI|nr:hypothetical protein B0T16DRAFT_419798 [Cercophora newfieldiana]